jgi:hypothetical protein
MLSDEIGGKLLDLEQRKEAAKVSNHLHTAVEKLRAIEEAILKFCTKPRTSSQVIQLFPARPFNILAIMENLRVKDMLTLAANKYVTNVEHREFDVSMTMTADRRSFTSKTEEMWSYSDQESKRRLLSKAHVIPENVPRFAAEEWAHLPSWVQKAVEYEHKHPAILAEVEGQAEYPDRPSIQTIKDADGQFYAEEVEESGGDWGVFDTEVGHCFATYSGSAKAEKEADKMNQEHGLGKYKKKKADDAPATINVNEQSQLQQVEGAEEDHGPSCEICGYEFTESPQFGNSDICQRCAKDPNKREQYARDAGYGKWRGGDERSLDQAVSGEIVPFGDKWWKFTGRMTYKQLRPGVIFGATYRAFNAGFTIEEFLGYSGRDVKYGEGGKKYDTIQEVFKAEGVNSLKALEAKQDEGEYGFHTYMCTKELSGKLEEGCYYYISEGRWSRGSGAEALSFWTVEEMAKPEKYEDEEGGAFAPRKHSPRDLSVSDLKESRRRRQACDKGQFIELTSVQDVDTGVTTDNPIELQEVVDSGLSANYKATFITNGRSRTAMLSTLPVKKIKVKTAEPLIRQVKSADSSFEEHVKKLMQEAFKYYSEQTKIIPDTVDIWNDVLNSLSRERGTTLTKEEENEVWAIITGEEPEGGGEDEIDISGCGTQIKQFQSEAKRLGRNANSVEELKLWMEADNAEKEEPFKWKHKTYEEPPPTAEQILQEMEDKEFDSFW